MQQLLSALTDLDIAAAAKVAAICLVISVIVAVLEPSIRLAVWSVLNFVAALFAFAARAVLTFVHFSAAKIREAIVGLAEEGQPHDGRPTPWVGWLVIGPIIYCVLLVIFVLCDITVAALIFQAMGLTLGTGSLLNIPIPIDATLAVVFVALAVFFGIVLFDLLRITPFAYIWSGLADQGRRTLLRIVLTCLGIELLAGLAMGVWSQAQLTGGLPQPWQTVLPWFIRGCLVVLLLTATALSGKPSGSAITGAGVVALIVLRLLAFVALVLLRLVLVFLRQITHIPLAAIFLVAFIGHKLWNWLAGFRWARALHIGRITVIPLSEVGGDAESPLVFRGADDAADARGAVNRATANKALMRRIYQEVFPSRDAQLDEFFAPDVINHDRPTADSRPGITAIGEMLTALRAEFPDLTVEVEDQVADADKVMSRIVLVGTQRGPFGGILGRPSRIPGVDAVRIRENRVVERWGMVLNRDMLQRSQAAADLQTATSV